jgi:hypothetical protein
MWEPRRLTTLWASMACYSDSFTFFILVLFRFYSLRLHLFYLTRRMTGASEYCISPKTTTSFSFSYDSSRVHEKCLTAQSLKNLPTFYGTWSFITVFTRALHWSVSWARSILSITLHPLSLRSILILSSRLCLGLPSRLFPSGLMRMIRSE